MITAKQKILSSEIKIEKSIKFDIQIMGRSIKNILSLETDFWNQIFNIKKSAISKLRLISMQDKRKRAFKGEDLENNKTRDI